jgi:hypothetical protein
MEDLGSHIAKVFDLSIIISSAVLYRHGDCTEQWLGVDG